ncbi:hypothetical protein GCM10027613_34840 [Microlunatus endophyticus]
MTIEQTRVIDDFGRYVYGIAPQAEPAVELRALDQPVTLGAGSRSRHELIISTERGRHLVELLLCLPNTDRSPVFSCLNFNGNDDVLATFPIDLLLRNGYGLATVHADAFEPDRADGAAEGVRRILPDPPAEAPWGTIGVWAWGLSVVRRELANLPHIRSDQVIAIGHSRMGKAALWSAAQDQGFAAVISNAAGCSGDSLHTHRAEGTEDIAAITGRFGYWFTPATPTSPTGTMNCRSTRTSCSPRSPRGRSTSAAAPRTPGPTPTASSWPCARPDSATAAVARSDSTYVPAATG